MSLFRKRNKSHTTPARPRFGPGRRLESDRDLPSCVDSLTGVLEMHAPTKYKHMPTLNEARILWHGDEPDPAEAWTCSYGTDDIFVFTFWPLESGGVRVGLFPLGGGDESLSTPLIGQWKQADRSLRSVGRFEPGLLTLLAPEVTQRYYEDLLKVAGKPCTPGNTSVLARQVTEMFLIKAHQFISSRDPSAASRFTETHRWTGDTGLPTRILEDLGNWNPQVLPYIQDLPGRVRGLLLEVGADGRPSANVWQQTSD